MKPQSTLRKSLFIITATEVSTIFFDDLKNPCTSSPVELEFGDYGEFSDNTERLIFLNIQTCFEEAFDEEIPAHCIRGLMSFIGWQYEAITIDDGANNLKSIAADVRFEYSLPSRKEDDTA
jgi:hypothetical protein